MAVLNAWQKLDRVISGKPFGSGADGAYSSATIPTLTKDSCSGTATSTTLTTSGSTFANGDILLIHQTRGTGAGQWEINKVASGGGSTSLTLSVALNYTYTDSGASQAQAVKIPQYTDVTVQSGTWTVPAWDGNVGGIFPIAINGTLTITGILSGVGNTGTSTNGETSAGGGFLGGASRQGNNTYAGQGEGTSGARDGSSYNANGSGGGGAYAGDGVASGGGGGNGTSGSNGSDEGSQTHLGYGGSTGGTSDLTTIVFGGGGGGSANQYDSNSGSGGNGGGIVMIFAKNITINGAIYVNGGNGGSGSRCSGGGGGGGSVLIVIQNGTLGTTLVTATGGTGGSTGRTGGVGGAGRIAVHHSGTVTGTTTPTFEDITDSTLSEGGFTPKILFI